MKYPRRVLTFAFVGLVLWAGVVRADSINPLNLSVTPLSVCPPSGCFIWDPGSTTIGLTLPPGGGTYQLAFTNWAFRNLDITTLKFFISATLANVSCGSSLFAKCTVTNPYPNSTLIWFSGGNIRPGQDFLLNFGCGSEPCSWPGGVHVRALTGTVPEPGTLALFLAGIAAILTVGRLWKTHY